MKNRGKFFARATLAGLLVVACSLALVQGSQGLEPTGGPGLLSLSLRDVSFAEAFEMISQKEQVNIVLSPAVQGMVSINLYRISLAEAIQAIAEAGGFVAEPRYGGYLIIPKDKVQVIRASSEIRTFKIQYSDSGKVKKVVEKYLSSQGRVEALEDRGILVVEDLPESLLRIARLVAALDHAPKQILIEAKILEITLSDSESFGLDWTRFFTVSDGAGSFGTRGLVQGSTGFVGNLLSDKISLFLQALEEEGRVRTLSTPKLLTLENQKASVVVGDRIGYKVSTTINSVTTESIEFLESGVILNVTPSVDREGRILLHIHPEVSTGSIEGDLPSQTTTEVTTDLLAENGQPIFIGGLIKNYETTNLSGVPGLMHLPLIGRLFSYKEDVIRNSETIVLITPHVLQEGETIDIGEKGKEMLGEGDPS